MGFLDKLFGSKKAPDPTEQDAEGEGAEGKHAAGAEQESAEARGNSAAKPGKDAAKAAQAKDAPPRGASQKDAAPATKDSKDAKKDQPQTRKDTAPPAKEAAPAPKDGGKKEQPKDAGKPAPATAKEAQAPKPAPAPPPAANGAGSAPAAPPGGNGTSQTKPAPGATTPPAAKPAAAAPAPPAAQAKPAPATAPVAPPNAPAAGTKPQPPAAAAAPAPAPVKAPPAPAPQVAAGAGGAVAVETRAPLKPPPPPSQSEPGPRPAAEAAKAALNAVRAKPEGGGFVEEILAALDRTFSDTSTPAGEDSPAVLDEKANREGIEALFAEIAGTYARPVRDFMAELTRGVASRDWVEICRPSLRSIAMAAEQMQLGTAAERMKEIDALLEAASKGADRNIGGEARQTLLQTYQRLIEVMPAAFQLGRESGQRDGVIINSLLKQIPEVGRVTVDKLYAAGLTSLDMLFKAEPKELAQATGIQPRTAELICQKVKQYREDSLKKAPKIDLAAYRARLGHLNGALRKANDAYDRTSDEEVEVKRKLRTERKNCAFQISIVLAELGEVSLVKDLDKLTFERRIQAVDDYLARTSK